MNLKLKVKRVTSIKMKIKRRYMAEISNFFKEWLGAYEKP